MVKLRIDIGRKKGLKRLQLALPRERYTKKTESNKVEQNEGRHNGILMFRRGGRKLMGEKLDHYCRP